ncbi:hypothetical protein INT45_012420 [Circinella minor]|uniref:Transcription factor domain-containing protein n=1 Tax=Circinella minor TaxID=1195481 RepID=A0A8H7S297_9FUNG|nr:hypothetical protein INT45_012420 [Circinella minor]
MAELILGPHNGLQINGTRPRRPKTRKKDRNNNNSNSSNGNISRRTSVTVNNDDSILSTASTVESVVPGTLVASPAMMTTMTTTTINPTSTNTTTEDIKPSHIMDLNQTCSEQWSVEALPDNNYRITIHSVHDVTDFLRALSLSTLRSNATLFTRHNRSSYNNSSSRNIVSLPYIKYHSELYAKTLPRPMTGYNISDLPSLVSECVYYFVDCMNHYYPIRPKSLLIPWCTTVEDMCSNPLALAIGAFWCRHVLIHHRPATTIKDSRILDAIQHQLSMMAREVLGECFDVPHVDHLFALCLCNMTASFSIEQKVLFHTIAVGMATELGVRPRQKSSEFYYRNDTNFDSGNRENIQNDSDNYLSSTTSINDDDSYCNNNINADDDAQVELNNRLWWYLFQIDHFLHESGAITSSLLRPNSDDHDALAKLVRPKPCSLDDPAEAAGACQWGHVLGLWITRRRLVKEIQALPSFDDEEAMMDKVNASIQEWSARVPAMPATMLEPHMSISMEKCTNHGLLLHYFCPPPPLPSNNYKNTTLTSLQRRAILHMVECFTNMICFRRIVITFKPCQTFPGDLKRSIEILVSSSKYKDPWIHDRARFGLLQARDVLDNMVEIQWHDPICDDMLQAVDSVLSSHYQEDVPEEQKITNNSGNNNDGDEEEEEDLQSRSIKMENNMYSGVMMFDRDLQPRARYYNPAKTGEPLDGLTIFENFSQYTPSSSKATSIVQPSLPAVASSSPSSIEQY